MNIMLNSLPTRTWNRLKMNESYVEVEGGFTNHTPEVIWDASEVQWEPQSHWDCAQTAHGLSADLTSLTSDADTALVRTAAGSAMSRPIVLKYCYEAGEHGASRLVLHAEQDSTLSAVLLLTSPAAPCTAALQIEICAEANAKVQLSIAQLMGENSLVLNEISGLCEENAAVDLVRLELGGKKSFSGANIDLIGRESIFNSHVGYHVKPEQLLDMNDVALHHGVRTNSLMEASGTLEEHARKIFRGTIDFRKGCAGAVGNERENVLLMCDEMVNQTIPLILCKEEDVEGNHGASIGQLDERVLFYLGSRGISKEMAQRIMAQSRIDAVCSRIQDDAIRAMVYEYENQEASDDAEL